MLRIVVELIPDGDDSKKKSLYHVDIMNDGTGTTKRGQYHYNIFEHDHIGEGYIHYIPIDSGDGIKHNRSDSVLQLIFKILKHTLKIKKII